DEGRCRQLAHGFPPVLLIPQRIGVVGRAVGTVRAPGSASRNHKAAGGAPWLRRRAELRLHVRIRNEEDSSTPESVATAKGTGLVKGAGDFLRTCESAVGGDVDELNL